MLQAGSILQERYVIEETIGHGGMATVYLASVSNLAGKRVAIKEMRLAGDDAAERDRAGRQFHKEAQMVAALDHPGLVEVLDYFEENAHQYLVTSYVHGHTLQALVSQAAGSLEVAQVVGWLVQLCDVLEYLHGLDPPLIFRDLKPSNVMLDAHGRVRLIDFGIARILRGQSPTSTFLTGSGTPGFAPVEQYTGGATDPQTDVYALGATAYHLLTGAIPPTSVARLAEEEELVPPRALNPAVPPHLEAAILRMLAVRKRDRFPTAAAVRSALLGEASVPAPSSPAAAPRCARCGASLRADGAPCLECVAPAGPDTDTAMPATVTGRMASVLFMDIVGYSTFRNEQQIRLVAELEGLLRGIPHLALLHRRDYYVDTRAGDAGVLVFFTDLTGPIESALYLRRTIRSRGNLGSLLSLRLGLHVGTTATDGHGQPVGDALNMGQRVANAGAPGAITASAAYSEMLQTLTDRYDSLLGPERAVDIKHGKRMRVVDVDGAELLPHMTDPAQAASPGGQPTAEPTKAPTTAAPPPRPEVTVASTGLQLRVMAGETIGRVIPLAAREIQVGRVDPTREQTGRISFQNPTVSSEQARLSWDERRRQYTLIHQSKTNPTLVNDRPVNKQVLKAGDSICMGTLTVMVEAGVALAAPPPDGSAQQEPTSGWAPDAVYVLRVAAGPDAGERFPLTRRALQEGRRILVGRSGKRQNDVTLHDPAISNHQARLEVRGGRVYLFGEDASSPVGLNGVAPSGLQPLAHGDCIGMGRTEVVFEDPSAPTHARLEIVSAPEGFPRTPIVLNGTAVTIGRLKPGDVVIPDGGVSRRHAVLTLRDGEWWLKHESRVNPTLVNGLPVPYERLLAGGDEIQLSQQTILRFMDAG